MNKIAVIGAGTMGNGIAHVFAQAGLSVELVDLNAGQLEKALSTISKNLERQVQKGLLSADDKSNALDKIHAVQNMQEGIREADLVVEAVTENEAVKLRIFRDLDEYALPGAILATNTSSISITKIAAVTKRPAQVIGMHFMNPVPVMKLVEIINGYDTAPSVTEKIVELARRVGKIPCLVQDYPGFISNRILMPMINEAIISLQEGVAPVETIDSIMKLGMAHPMGPLQLADFIGLDTCLAIMKVLQDGFGNPKYAPAAMLVNMVAAGHLGVKTGEGFYKYTSGSKELVVSDKFKSSGV
jgi:3-hydroxybutyryl-CoA dehydrogenase